MTRFERLTALALFCVVVMLAGGGMYSMHTLRSEIHSMAQEIHALAEITKEKQAMQGELTHTHHCDGSGTHEPHTFTLTTLKSDYPNDPGGWQRAHLAEITASYSAHHPD